MLKKIAFAGVGFALLATPLISSADTLTDLQTQIAGLLAQLKQLQSQLTQQQGAHTVTGGGTGVGKIVSSGVRADFPLVCPALKRALAYGASGDDVVELQKFLAAQGLLSSDSMTGFFGRMTEAAVQKLQAQNGIVSSGDHATTGWGAIGPTTRAWIARWCSGNNSNFSASPRSGSVPLTVTFRTTTTPATNDGTYTVEFGDGTTGAITYDSNAPAGVCAEGFGGPCNGYNSLVTSHTYTSNGTYVAKLMYQELFVCNAPPGAVCAQVMANPKHVGTVTIKVGSEVSSCPIYSPPLCNENEQLVGGGAGSDGCQLGPRCVPKTTTTSGAPSITGVDGPATLAVGQQGTWTVHASVGNNANTNLRYSVVWGDEAVLDQLNAFAGNTTSALQTSGSFAHAYANTGTYRPTFTVSNTAGSAQTSASVVVGSRIACEHAAPPSGCYWQSGATCSLDTLVCSGGNSTFSASPTSGAAPLAVIFRSNIVNNLDAYSIEFGDGTSGTLQNNCEFGYGACGLPTASHTYTSNSTYTAKLIKSSAGGCPGNVTDQSCLGAPASREIVGTVTITVGGGGTTSGTFSATPKTGAPPLMVTFTGVGNNIYFGDDGPTLVASGDGSLGTVTHVYRNSGEYTATSDRRSVTISVIPDRFASLGGAGSSSNLCVYNNRTYSSGTAIDVPAWSCGSFDMYRKCGGAMTAQGLTSQISTQKYRCSNSQWFDSSNIPLEGELVNATSCLASDGVTAVGNGQLIAQGYGAAQSFDLLGAFSRKLPTMKCDKGTWLNCDSSGNNCTQASAGTNPNLANALTALESALKALITKLGQ